MDLLRGYIQYLRDVSRKIVNRAGFENVLPVETRKKKNYYFNLDYTDINELFKDDEYSIPKTEREFTEYVKTVNSFLQSSDDHRWFFGLGIVHGKYEGSSLVAPLVTVICNINSADNGNLQINIDEQSYQVNYDLLAKFLNIKFDEEADEEIVLTQEEEDKFRAIEEIENEIFYSARKNKIPNTLEIFRKLKDKISNFQQVQENSRGGFVNETRFEDFFGSIYFTEHTFCFVRNVPNILSTYEALNDLLKQKTISNQLLEKLLSNSIKNQNEELPLSDDISEDDISLALNNIPFTLSKKQTEAIKKTWRTPITYIEGPPGTGKSYTIQALLHSALLLNKKVLFVSHKKPALKVVKKEVDKLLGKEAILYIATSDKKSGASDKKATIKYLKDLLDESDELTTLTVSRRQNDIDTINQNLSDLNNKIKKLKDDIEKDLQFAFEHFQLNEKFVDKRKFFTKDLEIKLEEYQFKEKLFDQSQFEKLFGKLKAIDGSNTTNALNEIFKVKSLKYFNSEFDADKKRLQSDINYYKDIFELNHFYSRGTEKKNKIDAVRLDNNRKRLVKLETEKTELVKEIFLKQFRFNILKKLFKNKEAKNSIQSYTSALRRVSPKAIIEYWEKVNFNLLTDIIPLWCAELKDLGIVFPMKNEIFDLIVVDEASQVNIAEIIPAFYRGKKFCIVGDDKQLHLNATGVGFALSKSFDNLCWNYNFKGAISVTEAKTRNLFVSDASILRFINSDLRAQRIPQTQLDEHHRSLPHLAKFNSDKFYQSSWKIMTENGKNRSINCFKAIKVNGSRDSKLKFVQAEIDELIKQLKSIVQNNGYLNHPDLEQFDFSESKPTIGVLAILRNQITKINETLEESGISDSEFEEFDIMVGTPEEFQGNEKDIMFFTLGLDAIGRWGKGHYEDVHRFNVATSRAKFFTYFIYGGIPRNANLIKKYLNHFGVKINEEDLIDTEKIPDAPSSPDDNWKYKPSNFESEFEFKVAEYLCEFKDKHPEIEIFNQVRACGQKRLDFVLYNRDKKITLVVEVDGINHFIGNSKNYTEAHLDRVEILQRAKWKILNVKYHNWYSNGWLCDRENEIFADELKTLFKNLNELLQTDAK